MTKLDKKVLRHKKVKFLLLIIVLLGLGYWAYGQISTYENKKDFQEANSLLSDVNASVKKKVGVQDNSGKSSNCSRSYQELTGNGEITCSTDILILYSVIGEDEAQKKINEIQNIVNEKSLLKPTKPISTAIATTGVVSKNYYGVQNFYKFKALDCTSKYVYNTPDDTFLKQKSPGIPLFVVIGCTGPAKKLYYPINQ